MSCATNFERIWSAFRAEAEPEPCWCSESDEEEIVDDKEAASILFALANPMAPSRAQITLTRPAQAPAKRTPTAPASRGVTKRSKSTRKSRKAIAAGRVRVKGRFARRDDSPEEESEDEGAVPPPPTAPPAAFYPVVLPLPVPATLSLPAPRHSEGQSEGLAPRTASPSPSLGGVETPTGGPGLAAGPASPTRLSIGCTATSEAL